MTTSLGMLKITSYPPVYLMVGSLGGQSHWSESVYIKVEGAMLSEVGGVMQGSQNDGGISLELY